MQERNLLEVYSSQNQLYNIGTNKPRLDKKKNTAKVMAGWAVTTGITPIGHSIYHCWTLNADVHCRTTVSARWRCSDKQPHHLNGLMTKVHFSLPLYFYNGGQSASNKQCLCSSESLKVPGQQRLCDSMTPESGEGKGSRTTAANQFNQLLKLLCDVIHATSSHISLTKAKSMTVPNFLGVREMQFY